MKPTPRLLLPLLSCFLLCTGVRAQIPTASSPAGSPYGTPKANQSVIGLRDAAAIDQFLYYIEGIGSPSREQLLRQNIKSYMMPIRTCPAPQLEWAYALTSAAEYYVNLNNNFKDNLSPDYLAMNLNAQGKPVRITDGLNLLVQEGTVSAAIVPYGSITIPRAVYSTEKVQIANFSYLFQPETRARNRVFETKKALSRGNPVIVALGTDASFTSLRTPVYSPAGALTETHYLTVVGYDSETGEFELRGIFGRLWAGAGYVRVSFDDFGRMATNGFVLVPR